MPKERSTLWLLEGFSGLGEIWFWVRYVDLWTSALGRDAEYFWGKSISCKLRLSLLASKVMLALHQTSNAMWSSSIVTSQCQTWCFNAKTTSLINDHTPFWSLKVSWSGGSYTCAWCWQASTLPALPAERPLSLLHSGCHGSAPEPHSPLQLCRRGHNASNGCLHQVGICLRQGSLSGWALNYALKESRNHRLVCVWRDLKPQF